MLALQLQDHTVQHHLLNLCSMLQMHSIKMNKGWIYQSIDLLNFFPIMKLWLNQKREHISTTLFFGHINCQKYSASFISHDTSILWRRRCKGSFQSQNEISMRSDKCLPPCQTVYQSSIGSTCRKQHYMYI